MLSYSSCAAAYICTISSRNRYASELLDLNATTPYGNRANARFKWLSHQYLGRNRRDGGNVPARHLCRRSPELDPDSRAPVKTSWRPPSPLRHWRPASQRKQASNAQTQPLTGSAKMSENPLRYFAELIASRAIGEGLCSPGCLKPRIRVKPSGMGWERKKCDSVTLPCQPCWQSPLPVSPRHARGQYGLSDNRSG